MCLTKVICKQKEIQLRTGCFTVAPLPALACHEHASLPSNSIFKQHFGSRASVFLSSGNFQNNLVLPSLFFFIWTLNNWCCASSSTQFGPSPQSLISMKALFSAFGMDLRLTPTSAGHHPHVAEYKKQHIDYPWLDLSVLQLLNFIFLGKCFSIPELQQSEELSAHSSIRGSWEKHGSHQSWKRAACETQTRNQTWLTLLQRPAVSHSLFSILSSTDAIIDLLLHMCLHMHACTPTAVNGPAVDQVLLFEGWKQHWLILTLRCVFVKSEVSEHNLWKKNNFNIKLKVEQTTVRQVKGWNCRIHALSWGYS